MRRSRPVTRKVEKESQKTMGPLYVMFRQREYVPIGNAKAPHPSKFSEPGQGKETFDELYHAVTDLNALKDHLWNDIRPGTFDQTCAPNRGRSCSSTVR